ncbi:MAG: aminopeptidase N [Gammaproteobacteria bacterium]|nr:aminopeptidase N [Gammaproteobacteria bacterium]MCF6230288.1 aminopeptidase N [Gammaproteobacteria bacterium]
MSQSLDNVIYLKDYSATAYVIKNTQLTFELGEGETRVNSLLTVSRREGVAAETPLVLDGEALTLLSIRIDGERLAATQYRVADNQLTISDLPSECLLAIETRLHPQSNTSLSGLYKSSGNFCTQCEAEGFRRITYYYDRPDAMSIFTTRIIADPQKYPVMLSNGNLVDKGTLADGRHWVQWQDPHPKPAYLFALVAGDLASIHDTFTTMNSREVDLYIYTELHNIDQCDYAMRSLKQAMKWDEVNYGREYDLDTYMIVAVDDFNMGAMENKGLNVFNSKYVLAKPETATDADYQGIEGVIGHEYFHNWSGNRVTCRDWFQLSLKEGFTVFRDQEFSADMQSRGVKRIEDVNMLRTHQFREDASPMAHPVRPESYVEINNFYTVTIYEKGGEVIRMQQLLLGNSGFRKGTDLYFDRHDGQAVTTDDFIKAMEDANGVDFSQFKRWYSQAGTPELSIKSRYDQTANRFTLTIRQHCPDTPGQTDKQPMHIPLAVGLLDQRGNDMPLQLQGEAAAPCKTLVLQLKQAEQNFQFENIVEPPVPSLLRGFSAPVKLNSDLSEEQRYFIMANDNDDYSRWDAGQQIAVTLIVGLAQKIQQRSEWTVDCRFIKAMEKSLCESKGQDKAMVAMALTLPSEAYLSGFMSPIDPLALHQARRFVREQIAQALQHPFLEVYQANRDEGDFKNDPASMAQRKLKNVCLGYLMERGSLAVVAHCEQQFYSANNMTDVLAALSALVNKDIELAAPALESFYDQWSGESLVVDKWLVLQATSRLEGALDRVRGLISHPAFKITNPNKVRSLIGAFCSGNPAQFHNLNGKGYALLSEFILKLNTLNPQIASRLVTPLVSWRKYDEPRQLLMKAELEKIAATPELSKDVYEMVNKALG